MSLNIKDQETHLLVRELAKLRGESMSTAVKTSVRERLERSRADAKKDIAIWLEEAMKYTAAALQDLPASNKIGDFLYDKETGMPL